MSIMKPPMARMITPRGRPMTSGGFWNIGAMNFGAMTMRMPTRPMGRNADHVAGHALLRGEGLDLALDADALADGEGDRVEDLGQVAAHLVLDGDGRGHQLQVLGADAADHVGQGLLEGQAEVDLADDAAELGRDGRLRLAHDQLDGLEERRAGAQRVGDQRDGVGEAVVEGLESLALAAVRARSAAARSRRWHADDDDERVCQGGQDRHAEQARRSPAGRRCTPTRMARNSVGLRREVGARELARQVGAPVAPLDDAC